MSAATTVTRFRSAVRKLSQHGAEALKPQLVVSQRTNEPVWVKPAISKRKANVLRKQALRSGTYGSFDSETGTGWDKAWDLSLSNASSQGRHRVRLPNKASHQRTREQRAQKIDKNLVGMDERIEAFYAEKHSSKPPNTFENHYKKVMRVSKK